MPEEPPVGHDRPEHQRHRTGAHPDRHTPEEPQLPGLGHHQGQPGPQRHQGQRERHHTSYAEPLHQRRSEGGSQAVEDEVQAHRAGGGAPGPAELVLQGLEQGTCRGPETSSRHERRHRCRGNPPRRAARAHVVRHGSAHPPSLGSGGTTAHTVAAGMRRVPAIGKPCPGRDRGLASMHGGQCSARIRQGHRDLAHPGGDLRCRPTCPLLRRAGRRARTPGTPDPSRGPTCGRAAPGEARRRPAPSPARGALTAPRGDHGATAGDSGRLRGTSRRDRLCPGRADHAARNCPRASTTRPSGCGSSTRWSRLASAGRSAAPEPLVRH